MGNSSAKTPAAVETSKSIIEKLGMNAHPEGGYYVETFRDSQRAQFTMNSTTGAEGSGGDSATHSRSVSTAILFLVPEGEVSHLHKLASSEVWHYHMGLPIVIVEISPDGVLKETTMSHRVDLGHKLQHTVEPGNWFGAYVDRPQGKKGVGFDFALVGCTVAPGFEFEDFELGKVEQLEALFPNHKEIIQKMASKSEQESS